jgi:hypothetical protein
LVVVLDMYVNGGLTDSHNHNSLAKCLGRYNPNTRSHSDGAVNQKLAEIKGQVEASRAGRHPGGGILALIDKYKNNKAALRADAITAWREICRDYDGPIATADPLRALRVLRGEQLSSASRVAARVTLALNRPLNDSGKKTARLRVLCASA